MPKVQKILLLGIFVLLILLSAFLGYFYFKKGGLNFGKLVLPKNPSDFLSGNNQSTEKYEFVSEVPGYMVKLGNREELEKVLSDFEVFQYRSGLVGTLDGVGFVPKKITFRLVQGLDSNNFPASRVLSLSRASTEDVVSISTTNNSSASETAEIIVYIAKEWLDNPDLLKEVNISVENRSIALHGLLNYQILYQLFLTSLKNSIFMVGDATPEEKLKYYDINVINRLENWQKKGVNAYPLSVIAK